MHAPQRILEILGNAREWNFQGRRAANQHVIVSTMHSACARKPHDLPQAPAHTVSLNGVADLLRHGEAAPRRALIAPLARLQHEGSGENFGSRRRGQEIRPLPQPFHGSNARLPGPVRPKAACARACGVPTEPYVRPWWPCASGNRDDAYVQACSVDRSASRWILRWSRRVDGGAKASGPGLKTRKASGPARDFARLIREGPGRVNVICAQGRAHTPNAHKASQGGEIRPPRPRQTACRV